MELSMKSRAFGLIITTLLMNISAQPQPPSFNDPFFNQPNMHNNIPAEVPSFPCTVKFYFNDEGLEKGFNQTEFHSSVMRFPDITSFIPIPEAELDHDHRKVKTEYTDSIVVDGSVGIPLDVARKWMFLRDEGQITLFTSYPDTLFLPYYQIGSNEIKEVPSFLSAPYESTPVTDLNRVIARAPRIYTEYSKLGPKAILTYNELDESELLPVDIALEVAVLTKQIFESSRLNHESITKVLALDSSNVIGHIKMAEYYVEEELFDSAQIHLNLAKEYSHGEYYYLYMAIAEYHFEREEYGLALDNFGEAWKRCDLTDRNSFNRHWQRRNDRAANRYY